MKSKSPAIVTYWKKHKFKITVACSVAIIAALALTLSDRNQGTYSLEYSYESVPMPIHNARRFVRMSKGEAECRRVLEKFFCSPFPNIRPDFMRNSVTGKPLEIDCCNLALRLGCEYNGKQHYEYVSGMHKNHESFRLQQYRDDMKKKLCAENGLILITVPYTIAVPSIENFLREKLESHGFKILV